MRRRSETQVLGNVRAPQSSRIIGIGAPAKLDGRDRAIGKCYASRRESSRSAAPQLPPPKQTPRMKKKERPGAVLAREVAGVVPRLGEPAWPGQRSINQIGARISTTATYLPSCSRQPAAGSGAVRSISIPCRSGILPLMT